MHLKSKTVVNNLSEMFANYTEHMIKRRLSIWRNNVKIWFAVIQTQFIIFGITAEETKFHILNFAIDSNILTLITDLVKKNK